MSISLNKTASIYFDRFDHKERLIKDKTPSTLELIVVIPCYNEPDLIRSLNSLKDAVIPDGICIEVITVINHAQNATEEIVTLNNESLHNALKFSQDNKKKGISFYTVLIDDMPIKKAGVGLARKIGMDEALHRFSDIDKDGIIVCFDADSRCEGNYFEALLNHFNTHKNTPGCSIHFEHPLEGEEFSKEEYEAIILYELHLRYYKNALTFSGLPYVFHTIGSSMAVRASAYAKQGGMNKRKAGEDFYFLNKIIQLGNFTELNSTKVIPSPRISDRVPFGTGKAVAEIIDEYRLSLDTYNYQVFEELKHFVDSVFKFGKDIETSTLKPSIKEYIEINNFSYTLQEITKNTASEAAFLNRFFKVFDAFWMLKFVHFARDNYYKQEPVLVAANKLLLANRMIKNEINSEKDLLKIYREIDKKV